MNREDSQAPENVGRSLEDATVRQLALPPLPPVQFKAEQYMNGVRVTCEGRDRKLERDGTVSYRIRWTADVDTLTQLGKDQGRARSVVVDSLDAPGEAKLTVERLITDPKFASGYFIAEGVDSRGNASAEYVISGKISNQILDSSVPADVTHLQISGSGEFVGGDVVEALSVACRAPLPLGSFDGVQLFLKDYISLGSIQEGEFHRHNGVAGASMQFKVNYQIAKRVGVGTSVTVTNGSTAVSGVGTQFTTQAQAGDVIEVGMRRGTVQSVTDDTHLTLTGNWTALTLTTGDYAFYAKVTIYAISISKGGTHRSDVTNAPSVAVLFDGSLGTPNAPTITATVLGNAVRIEFPIVAGTKIAKYRLYRGTGSGVAFTSCTVIDELPQPKSDIALTSSNMQFEDSSFDAYQKEQGQFFTYYVTTVNERGDESAASNSQSVSCRLDSPEDTEIGGRLGLKNYLFNAMFSGTAAGNVADNDANQDINLFTFVDGGYTPGIPGRPYGGNAGQLDGTGRFKGYTRWAGTKTGGAAALPSFQNGNEILMPAPGFGQSCYVFQEFGAWDDGRVRFMKMKKNAFIVFQIKMRHSGAAPNGGLALVVEQYNNNTLTGNAKRRYRDTAAVLQFATGTNSNFDVSGSLLLSTWQTFWAVYQFDASLGTTTQIRFTFEHHDTNNGNDIYICEPMVNDGTDRGAWTADMADPYVSMPVPINPSPDPTGDGRRPWDKFV